MAKSGGWDKVPDRSSIIIEIIRIAVKHGVYDKPSVASVRKKQIDVFSGFDGTPTYDGQTRAIAYRHTRVGLKPQTTAGQDGKL